MLDDQKCLVYREIIKAGISLQFPLHLSATLKSKSQSPHNHLRFYFQCYSIIAISHSASSHFLSFPSQSLGANQKGVVFGRYLSIATPRRSLKQGFSALDDVGSVMLTGAAVANMRTFAKHSHRPSHLIVPPDFATAPVVSRYGRLSQLLECMHLLITPVRN